MIEFRSGDILAADVEALVNTVNCVGIMGRGIALQFKNRFPENFKAYVAACSRGEVQPGRMFVYETGTLTNPRLIVNFPTKRHWRGKSRMEDIESGLLDLAQQIEGRAIRSVAIPPLGSGLGGLKWDDVRSRIIDVMDNLAEVQVVVFAPSAVAASTKSRDVPTMTSGRAALVALVNRYLCGHMDPFVTLLELHKLMYFMQEAGEPLRLRYVKHAYGPYAENLRHVMRAVDGHLLAGYADGGDAPGKQIELVPSAVKDAEQYLAGNDATLCHLERVSKLVDGFETPFGLELLATVHWVAAREGAVDDGDVVNKVYAWSNHKQQFSRRQLGIALTTLRQQGWLTAA